MRKLAPLLFALGAFLLVAGLVALIWAPGVVKKTPLDVDSTTRLEGQVEKLNTSTGELEQNPAKAESITKADSENSTDSVVLFASSQCLVIDVDDAPDCVDGDDPRLVTASTDTFATDRKTALAVDSDALPADAVPHSGVINKWPFDAAKKTYPYWDGAVGDDVPAVFDRTETVRGLEVNVYEVSVQDAEIQIAEGVDGTYDDAKEIWVDPATGSIINQIDDQQRYLASGDKVLDLQLAFTDAQVAANVEDAKDNAASLKLITFWVPIIGIVAGLLVILAGVLLLRRGRRSGGAHVADADDREPTRV
ncbi:DUF3068 domain-containing protein [Marmoricola sp. Leaf446]|uniref:DUF3068 domain-containing protein n=1 Tax=Marmoricola sp. Leaf446 TaxID=1736379 RepID=UPI0009E93064|nr:DUF3068 domain-containing protein [Marmoricola sp. Leaf446]